MTRSTMFWPRATEFRLVFIDLRGGELSNCAPATARGVIYNSTEKREREREGGGRAREKTEGGEVCCVGALLDAPLVDEQIISRRAVKHNRKMLHHILQGGTASTPHRAPSSLACLASFPDWLRRGTAPRSWVRQMKTAGACS